MSQNDPGDIAQGLGSEGQPIDPGLARQMSELARTMQAESDPQALLSRIVHSAVEDIPNAIQAGITLITSGRLETPAATDPIVREVDIAQYQTGQGPCVDASLQGDTYVAADLAAEERWPDFAARAVQLGIRSMLSVRLFVQGHVMGALNLYADGPGAFDFEDENVALLLGAHAAVALADAQKVEHLSFALSSRDVIGQAKGILMERYKIGQQHAFEMLVWASQHSHTKLRDVALTLCETGEFNAD